MCPLTSPLQLKLWPSQSHPHRSHNVPHANHWPACQQCMHNTTSRSCFHAGLNRLFFFIFFPRVRVLCSPSLTTHTPPCAPLCPELEAPTPSQALTNTTLHTRHRITPPQSHSHCCLYATLVPLCTPALKPRTCTTHARPVEVSVFVGARTGESAFLFFYFYFFFFTLLFFFQSCMFVHPFNTHPNTVLARPHPCLARRQNSGAIARS